MKIQIVSYTLDLISREKLTIAADIINSSNSDLIVFPGETLDTIDEALELTELVKNKKTQYFWR